MNIRLISRILFLFTVLIFPVTLPAENNTVVHQVNNVHQTRNLTLFIEAIKHLPPLKLESSNSNAFQEAQDTFGETNTHKAIKDGFFHIKTEKKTHLFEYHNYKAIDGFKSYELLAEQSNIGLAVISLNTIEDSLGFRALYLLDKKTDTLYHLNAEGDAGFDIPIFSKDGHAALLYENFVYDETSYMVLIHFDEQYRKTHYIRPIAIRQNNFHIDAVTWDDMGNIQLKTHQTKDVNPNLEPAITNFSYWKIKTP